MKNENKCFFSISLENGIVITGNNPKEVKDFLTNLHICIRDAIESGLNDKHPHWKEYIIELHAQIGNATTTIYNNTLKKG